MQQPAGGRSDSYVSHCEVSKEEQFDVREECQTIKQAKPQHTRVERCLIGAVLWVIAVQFKVVPVAVNYSSHSLLYFMFLFIIQVHRSHILYDIYNKGSGWWSLENNGSY